MELQISNLEKTYKDGTKALDGINLNIGKGMFGLLGPNGAGKSTLMRTIATLQLADKGNISFRHIDVNKNPIELRKILGYLPQEFGVYPRQNADQLLDYFARIKGIVSKKDRNTIIDSVLEITNLRESRKRHVSSYSGGMKQRFGIAQLLLNNPQLIIVDEPTAGLDPTERQRFLNVLRELGFSRTVILSTHIVEDVKGLCTEMAIINHGKVLEQNTPQNILESIKGKVWSFEMSRTEFDQIEDQYDILSSSYTQNGQIRIKTYSEFSPTPQFSLSNPTLEDAYFIALRA